MTKVLFLLERQAKRSGGDRYKGMLQNGEEMVIYIPQSISRPKGYPIKSISVEFSTE